MAPVRRVDFEAVGFIRGCLIDNMSGPDIYHRLKVLYERGDLKGTAPTLRTVQRVIADIRDMDRSEPWRFGDCKPGEAPMVLAAIRQAILWTEGRVNGFSRAEVGYLMRIAEAFPELHQLEVAWRLARLYVLRESAGDPTDDLDALLAFAPWRRDGDEGWPAYTHAAARGWIARAPFAVVETVRTGHPVMADEHLSGTDREMRLRELSYRPAVKIPNLEMRDLTEDAAEPT